MQVTLEKLIQLITAEIVKELKKQQVTVIDATKIEFINNEKEDLRTKSEVIDMSMFKTPVLTESHLKKLNRLTGKIIVPRGTVITPKARELIREKDIRICEKT